MMRAIVCSSKVLMKCEQYVGAFAQGAILIQQDLSKIHQLKYDARAHTAKLHSVEEYYIDFMEKLNLHPADQDYAFNLVAIFYGNMTKGLKDEAVAAEWIPLLRPVDETNAQALERLCTVETRMESYKRHLMNVKAQVKWGGGTGFQGASCNVSSGR